MKHMLPPFGTALPGALSIAVMLIAAPAAHAQMAPGTNGSGMLTGPVVGTAQVSNHRDSQPPAIPGARTTDNDPAPADKLAADMRPTDALFDSVNRGDITAARDAIGRGADLDARNVLGLTPLDLAVDLGRNDITFLLLSLRGATGGVAPPPAESGKSAPPVRTATRPQQHPAPRPVVAERPAAPPEARQYADTPATPVPQAGFLGFSGAGR